MLNRAEIDLAALVRNARKIKKKLGGAKFNAVVKADAYGHGAAEIAAALYPYADCYSVAIPEEGAALRQSGIDKDILVLNEPFECDLPLYARYRLTMTVSRGRTLRAAARMKGIKAHIKVNTGMNRQGVSLDGLGGLLDLCDECGVTAEGMYSHLRAPEDEKTFSAQLDCFLLAYKEAKRYNKNIVCHLSASGGFLKGAYFDMCRIGLLLYGYKPFRGGDVEVEPIMRVYAPAVAHRSLKKGEGLFYGTRRMERDADVSIVRYGYADGLPRARGGLPAERCMDVSAYEGFADEVAVLDGDADKLAEIYGTATYEILCHAARRAEKIYLR